MTAPARTRERELPLTGSQAGLLMVCRTVPAAHLYNVVTELDLNPDLTPQRLAEALRTVLAIQPALRLAFRDTPHPHAVLTAVPGPGQVPLENTAAPADLFDQRRAELLDRLGRTSFDPTRAPLLRAVLLRAEDGTRAALLLVVHHLVFDGFSLSLFAADLSAAVRGLPDQDALCEQREQALYRELAAQSAIARDERTEQAAAALAERLRTTSATVLHPRPGRPSTTDFTGSRTSVRLTNDDSQRLDALCSTLGVTPFAFFAALYAVVLARHTAQDEVVFGSPVVARRTAGSFALCGFFVNTLPTVLDVRWDEPFEDFVRGAARQATDALRRDAAVSFDQVVRHAAPDRSSNRNPLFSCMLAMQDTAGPRSDSVVRAVREHGNDTAKFDLWLGATPSPEGWLLELEHDVRLLPHAVADALADSLRGALHRALRHPGANPAELFEDAPASGAHPGRTPRPPFPDLHQWLNQAAHRRPTAIAVEEDDRSLTHHDLDRLADTAAGVLAERGVGPGTVVGLTTSSLVDTVVAIRALLALRAVFLPLDLTLPADRLAHMVRTARCALVIGEDAPEGTEVVSPAALATSADHPGAPNGTQPGGTADGVYVMFTSGSTGLPKGVLMHNGPLVNLTAWQIHTLGMDEHTRFLQYAPLGFDVSFQEIIPTLVAGGTVVSRTPADRRDLPAVVRRVREQHVTHLYLPVAALRPFARAAEQAGENLSDLREVCVSGEQLMVDDAVEEFFAARPHLSLLNLYGPTETHAVTTHRLTGRQRPWPRHVPIGRPLPGVDAHVLDRAGRLAPVGVPGELHLGGDCPATGYISDPARTRERFLPDPRGGHPGARMYRTGDQVLHDEHGDLVFLGRNDDQVKIRGHRVELGELETAVSTHPGVRQAVATVHGDAEERRLVVFTAPEPGAVLDEEDIVSHCARVLPAYMVPARVLTVTSVPVTPNGKVHRAALLAEAEPALRRPTGTVTGTVRTDDPVERRLQHLWAELLAAADVPVDRSLLEYGAHSLNVLTALSQVEQLYGVRVPILDFFAEPTVRALARAVTAATPDRDGDLR
ncbi:amino acid adenylation domain-containing protein [Streptomyces sp. TRM 70361]|uniref:non-ribosomal peptide synthetase n=1 Tax=Streptomyces sp. TRM 70361 TaxID=3116553 RepID=UPI002E7AF7C1|nr:amino acid adenylation domain-containing protein [Streptomyces sp. TRM 70361]MEE1943026.1 amino acid adenylation domain-containing protein [Streptomyces sp. TRM 70361]